MCEKVKCKIEYQYDALNRLTSVRYGKGSATRYAYNPAGNLVAIETISENIDSSSEKPRQQPAVDNAPEPEPVQWYLHRQGQQFGPYSQKQLRQFNREGRLEVEDLLWHDALEGWIPLEKFEQLFF